jgi:hypothetical protein
MASSTDFLIALEADSILIIVPFLMPVALAMPIPVIVNFSSMGGGVKTWIQFAKKTTEQSMDIVLNVSRLF